MLMSAGYHITPIFIALVLMVVWDLIPSFLTPLVALQLVGFWWMKVVVLLGRANTSQGSHVLSMACATCAGMWGALGL